MSHWVRFKLFFKHTFDLELPAGESRVESLYLAIGGTVLCFLLLLFAVIVFVIKRKVSRFVSQRQERRVAHAKILCME